MYLIAIDQGTTSSRVVLYDYGLKIIAKAQKELTQFYPDNGWVEHDPLEIFDSIVYLINQCLEKACEVINLSKTQLLTQIKSLGITNQRETTILWDKTTGQPLHNAIVWQDRRTAEFCNSLKNNKLFDYAKIIQQKTGLLIDPYFSASKINWLLTKYNSYQNSNILFGTIDTYLIWRLTNGQSHVTDATNASRTQLYNIKNLEWDNDLLAIFNIPKHILPSVKNSVDDFGITSSDYFGASIPIQGVAGDQQAAAIGQLCIQPTSCKITYGTGCFVLQNTGDKFISSNHQLISTIGYLINNKVSYALEGSIFVAGATIQWLRDALRLINKAEDSEHIAKNLDNTHGTNGVYLVPAFTGLGAPYWDPLARGAILGLTRETGLEHIVRAALESVCYQTRDLLSAFKLDYDLPTSIFVDGGMTNNNWLLQFLADITRMTICKPCDIESTVRGASILAGIGAGVFSSLEQLKKTNFNLQEQQFSPSMPVDAASALYNGWLAVVQKLLQK